MTTTNRQAYGCLYVMVNEDPHHPCDEYELWRATVLQVGRTSFPDSLVEVLGRFIPLDKTCWLHRLQELEDRTRASSQEV